MAIDRNLEVIIADYGALLAYRSDLPVDMRHMVDSNDKWCFTVDIEDLDEVDFNRLRLLCREHGLN